MLFCCVPMATGCPREPAGVSPDSAVLCQSCGGGGVHTRIQTETQKPHQDPTRQAGREHRTVRDSRTSGSVLARVLARARGSLEANACLKSETIKICLNVPGVARTLPVFPVEHGGKMLLLFCLVVLLLRLLLKVLNSEIHIIGCCLHLDLACTSLVVSLAKQDKLDGAFTMSSLINAHLYSESTHDGVSL